MCCWGTDDDIKKSELHFTSIPGLSPLLGAEAGAIPAASISVVFTRDDGKDAGPYPAPPMVLATTASLSSCGPFPLCSGGMGIGSGGQPGAWHRARCQDHDSCREASTASASSEEPRGSQDSTGHGDLDRLFSGLQRLLLTPNYLLVQISWPG